MKFRNLLFGVFALLSVSAIVIYNSFDLNKNGEIKKPMFQDLKVTKGINGALEYYNRLRVDPFTGTIDPLLVSQAREAFSKMSTSKAAGINWNEMGPNNIGGRVRALLIDKTNPQIMYAGGVAGGLWKSKTGGQSWTQIKLADNIAVSCIAQSPIDGTIYVGTGEGLATASGTNYNSGSYGAGMYKSLTDSTFTKMTGTEGWIMINRAACDKDGRLVIATESGLKLYFNGAWSSLRVGSFKDVKFGKNSTIGYATSNNTIFKITTISVTTEANQINSLPVTNVSRIEIGISPSNENIAFALNVKNDGSLQGIYKTSDGGTTWALVGIGQSPSLDVFGDNKQGWYDAVCMVHATDPNIVYVGGISLWKGVFTQNQSLFTWTKISQTNDKNGAGVPIPTYIHADLHALTQHPTQANTFFIGSDGGVFKTSDGGATYAPMNKNLAITQFYMVACSPSGNIMGGTQDNSTPYLDGLQNDPKSARDMFVGDGGWSAFSSLSQKVLFATSQFGTVGRSNDNGEKWQYPVDPSTQDPDFFNAAMKAGEVNKKSAFVTPILLWETENFANNTDGVYFIADKNYLAGNKIYGRSALNNKYPFEYTLTQNLNKKDTIVLMDKTRSHFFVGGYNSVWMTKQALYFGKQTPDWYKIATVSGTVAHMQISKDGDALFFTINSDLYRLTNILSVQDSVSGYVGASNYQLQLSKIKSFSGVITSVGIDPADANRVVVTLGGFSSSYNHVWLSTNALDPTPVFTSKGNGTMLTSAPVYASLIPVNKPKVVILGTEFGVIGTEDITAATPVWVKMNDGIEDLVPVFHLTQQRNQMSWKQVVIMDDLTPVYSVYPGIYNYGTIYAATHGRGFFTCKTFTGIDDVQGGNKSTQNTFKIYPNPVTENTNVSFELTSSNQVFVNIYDLRGKLIQTISLGMKNKGLNNSTIEVNSMAAGTYIMQIVAGEQRMTQKFIMK